MAWLVPVTFRAYPYASAGACNFEEEQPSILHVVVLKAHAAVCYLTVWLLLFVFSCMVECYHLDDVNCSSVTEICSMVFHCVATKC